MGADPQNSKSLFLLNLFSSSQVAIQYHHSACLDILRSFDQSPEEPLDEDKSQSEGIKNCESIFRDITKEFLEVQGTRIESARQAHVTERHMFSSTQSSVIPTPPAIANLRLLPALSKFVEYPGDPLQLASLLEEQKVDPGGKDMLGYSALHKFASWDKVDLLELLCPHLSPALILAPAGGKSDPNHYTCLHLCVEMRSWRALRYLTSGDVVARYEIDLDARDKNGRTFKDLLREHLAQGKVQIEEVEEYLPL
jgi:hypothetical protein